MNEPDPGVIAVNNLLAALSMTMLTNGQGSHVRTLLGMFESMCDQTLSGENLAAVKSQVAAQRAVVQQMVL